MTIDSEITRFVRVKDVVTHFKTLKTAAEEADDYIWMRASENAHICQHGENIYPLLLRQTDDVLEIACGCPAWKHAHDNDGCKHTAAFLKRSKPPQKPITYEIARDLMAAGWTGRKGNMHPPLLTSDPDGEEDGAPTPAEPPKREPVTPPGLEEKIYSRTCPHCDERIEGMDLDDVKMRHRDHIKDCDRNPANMKEATVAESATVEKPVWDDSDVPIVIPERAVVPEPDTTETQAEEDTKMAEEDTKTKIWTAPDGKEFASAEALLDYAETQKATDGIADGTTRKQIDSATFIAPMIRNLGPPQLTEAGGIRIGKKRSSGKGAETFDHFVFTLPEKDPKTGDFLVNEEMTDLYGENCTELPVRLLSDDITECFTTFYAKYGAGGIKIRGDGMNWAVTNPDGSKTYIEDPNGEHRFLQDPEVKPHGILTVLVDGQNSVGTVYRFRTTGWNSIKGILASLALCSEIAKRAGGRLAFMPMTLIYRTKEVTPKGERYKKTIPVITVEFRGTIERLQERSREATKYLSAAQDDLIQLAGAGGYDPDVETPEEMEDVRAEFHPERRD